MINRLRFIVVLLILFLLAACQSAPQGEITVHYADNAQFELIDDAGNRVLIDVHNPRALSAPATETDILLTTHTHPDHVNTAFLESFPGQQLFLKVGEIETPEISVIGIASTHTAYGSDELKDENGSNYIYVIEISGLRVAHFGDIGQDELSPEQLAILGEVDIALTQFVNSFSQMDNSNQKGFNLINQVAPRLIIPTHGNGNMDAVGYANEQWHALANPSNTLVIRKSDLGEETQFVVVGLTAESMQAIYDLPTWGEK